MSQESRVEAAPGPRWSRPDGATLRSWWPGWRDVACLVLLVAATFYLVGQDGGRPYRPMLPVLLLAIPATIATLPTLRRLPTWVVVFCVAWTVGPVLSLLFADVRAGWVRRSLRWRSSFRSVWPPYDRDGRHLRARRRCGHRHLGPGRWSATLGESKRPCARRGSRPREPRQLRRSPRAASPLEPGRIAPARRRTAGPASAWQLSDDDLAASIDPTRTRFGDQLQAAEQLAANDRPDLAQGVIDELRPVLDQRRAWGVAGSVGRATALPLELADEADGCSNFEAAWTDLGPWADRYGVTAEALDTTTDVIGVRGLTTPRGD